MPQVGGRPFNYTKKQITDRMRGEQPEEHRTYLVGIGDVDFPPKQVIAALTGWDRNTFTSLEARRVLENAGLPCRRVNEPADSDHTTMRDLIRRVEALEAGLASANEAIVKLIGNS